VRRSCNVLCARTVHRCVAIASLLCGGGCATVPIEQTGVLSSYQKLETSDGILTHARIAVNKTTILAAATVRIMPTSFSQAAFNAGLTEAQRRMVANVVDRAMCTSPSDRFHIVPVDQPADLRVHAVVTYVGLTDEKMAVASKVTGVGVSIAESAFLPPLVRVPTPRIPLGLGGLAIEAEANDRTGHQEAAMVWARGADAFTSKPKVSTAGDAYDLAKSFADDFGKLLVTGASPFKKIPSLPSLNAINAALGGPPKEAACESFGRGPGLVGLVGDSIGLPPEWIDKGPPANGADR
jgi:Protein of unknown function (DUF3313)